MLADCIVLTVERLPVFVLEDEWYRVVWKSGPVISRVVRLTEPCSFVLGSVEKKHVCVSQEAGVLPTFRRIISIPATILFFDNWAQTVSFCFAEPSLISRPDETMPSRDQYSMDQFFCFFGVSNINYWIPLSLHALALPIIVLVWSSQQVCDFVETWVGICIAFSRCSKFLLLHSWKRR